MAVKAERARSAWSAYERYQRRILTAVQYGGVRDAALCWHRQAGKTEVALRLLARLFLSGSPGTHLYVAPYYRQAMQVAWPRLRQILAPYAGQVELRADGTALSAAGRIVLAGGDVDPDRLRGLTVATVVYDEVAQLEPRIYQEVIPPALSRYGPEARQIWIGTPRGRGHWCDLWHALAERARTDPTALAERLTVDDTRVLDRGFLARARRQMPESLYRQEYYCEWLSADDGWIPETAIDRALDAAAGDPARYGGGLCVAGLDLARSRDSTALVVLELRGGGASIVREVWTVRDVPLLQQCELIRDRLRRYRLAALAADTSGVGQGAVERLQEVYGALVRPVSTASAPVRVELLTGLRDALAGAEMPSVVLPDDPRLRRDLLSIRLGWSPLGQPKLTLDRVDGSHADTAVALALALAEVPRVPVPIVPQTRLPRATAATIVPASGRLIRRTSRAYA